MASDPPESPPEPRTRVLDFDTADIEAVRTSPPQFLLVVRGETPHVDADVELAPREYATRPDYWGIEVLGRTHGQVRRRPAPFTASILLAGFTGSEGVEVIGETRTIRLDVPSSPPATA